MNALQDARAAGNNTTKLKKVFDKYFGEDLAKRPVARRWASMDASARKAQTDRARRVTVSLANKLARYADATFTWRGNVASVDLRGERGTIVVYPVPGGCTMSDICIKDIGCLSSYIGRNNAIANGN